MQSINQCASAVCRSLLAMQDHEGIIHKPSFWQWPGLLYTVTFTLDNISVDNHHHINGLFCSRTGGYSSAFNRASVVADVLKSGFDSLNKLIRSLAPCSWPSQTKLLSYSTNILQDGCESLGHQLCVVFHYICLRKFSTFMNSLISIHSRDH